MSDELIRSLRAKLDEAERENERLRETGLKAISYMHPVAHRRARADLLAALTEPAGERDARQTPTITNGRPATSTTVVAGSPFDAGYEPAGERDAGPAAGEVPPEFDFRLSVGVFPNGDAQLIAQHGGMAGASTICTISRAFVDDAEGAAKRLADLWNAALASPAQPETVAAGMVIVPREPTRAYIDVIRGYPVCGPYLSEEEAGDIYDRVIAAAQERAPMTLNKCPRCNSPKPHLHPAVQCEGEVEICTHDFHLQPTNQNRQQYIDGVLRKRAEKKEPRP